MGDEARDYCGDALASAAVADNQSSSDRNRQTKKARTTCDYELFGCYWMDENGLFLKAPSRKPGVDADPPAQAEHHQSQFISGPFEVLGRVRNPNGEDWARLLRWTDDDDRIHTFAVSDADLHGEQSALCANLASRGLKIATRRSVRVHLVSYLNEIWVEDRVTVVERTGWHEVDGAHASFPRKQLVTAPMRG